MPPEQFPWNKQIILKIIKEDNEKLWWYLEMQKIIQLKDYIFLFISNLTVQTNCIQVLISDIKRQPLFLSFSSRTF